MEFEHTLQLFRPKLLRTIRLRPAPRFPVAWRYIATGLAGLFIGITVTYWAMQPPGEAASLSAERTVVLPLNDQMIGTLRRPIDLATIKPQTVSVQKIEENVLTPMSFAR